jgi:epoxyqueuosine reductase
MDYMKRHGLMRARAQELVEGTTRVISVRMDYLPPEAKFARTLKKQNHAYISRYALGRDYHKLIRKRLKQLGDKISDHCETFNFRPFVDSAPILERPLAEKAGLGWVGKHSLLINKSAGSWFFLGELLVNIPLPISEPASNECGSCVSCIKICPTQAIVAPYVVDARRCISYLTIELRDAIPEEFRPLIGNRIYGCDDCQLICPWNKFANLSEEGDFSPRQNLDNIELLTVFSWDEKTFLSKTEGSPIRRIGFQSWQRNIAVALGNAPYHKENVEALNNNLTSAEAMVSEHIYWALSQQDKKRMAIEQKNTLPVKNQRLTERLVRSVEKGLPRDA